MGRAAVVAVTVPRVETVSRNGSRLYRIPCQGAEPVLLPGVTSVLDTLSKPALPRWAANETARAAADNMALLRELDPDGIYDFLRGAPWRSSSRAAGTGTDVHGVAERLDRGEKVTEVDVAIAHAVRGLLEYRRAFAPRAVEVEVTGANLSEGYAGTFDAIVEVEGGLFIVDYKTSRDIYAEVCLQLAAYRHFEVIVDPDGSRRPMPAVAGALAVHLPKPEDRRWAVHRVQAGPDEYTAFLGLLAAWRWRNQHAKGAVGEPIRERARLVPY